MTVKKYFNKKLVISTIFILFAIVVISSMFIITSKITRTNSYVEALRNSFNYEIYNSKEKDVKNIDALIEKLSDKEKCVEIDGIYNLKVKAFVVSIDNINKYVSYKILWSYRINVLGFNMNEHFSSIGQTKLYIK